MATLTETACTPGQCIHKLPTSCQLTAQSTCCACGDERPHASSFRRYVDGAGFVLGGKRQEQYCPNCRQFWDARIEASGISQDSTRIPTVPDQTSFIQQWFDWQRGYSILTSPDGTEERHLLTGEPLSEVEPGRLPRTAEQLQADLEASQARISNAQDNADDSSEDIDSSGTSESTVDNESDESDESENNTSTAQGLLRDLQQNIIDTLTNITELTVQLRRPQASSEISTISGQLNSITRDIGTIQQHHGSNPQGRRRRQRAPDPEADLDNDSTRPAPAAEGAKMMKMECKVCMQQLSNQVLLPCGHCCLCYWCGVSEYPRQNGDRTRPKDRRSMCVFCRQPVKQIVFMYPV